NMEVLSSYIFLIPVFVFFSVYYQVLEQKTIRNKQYKVKAKASIAQAIVLNFSKTSLGLISPKASLLIILSTLGQFLGALFLKIGLRKPYRQGYIKDYSHKIDFRFLRRIAKKYRDFPKYR